MASGIIDSAAQAYAKASAETPVQMAPFRVTAGRPIIQFPSDLGSKDHPYVTFTAYTQQSAIKAIALPVPPGLSIGDGMSYSSVNLGIIGTIMAETLTQVSAQKSIAGAVGAGIGGLIGSTVNKAKQLNAAAGASILARKFGFNEAADVVDFNQRQVLAPNTNTTFQSSSIRSYAFTFKMVSRSKQEAATIKDIVSTLRLNMYPEGKDVVLSYPPIWRIKFYDREGVINPYLPKIHDTYLTSLSTTFNASTNIFHEDGSPVETDIALTFQETKALTKSDIEKLENNKG